MWVCEYNFRDINGNYDDSRRSIIYYIDSYDEVLADAEQRVKEHEENSHWRYAEMHEGTSNNNVYMEARSFDGDSIQLSYIKVPPLSETTFARAETFEAENDEGWNPMWLVTLGLFGAGVYASWKNK